MARTAKPAEVTVIGAAPAENSSVQNWVILHHIVVPGSSGEDMPSMLVTDVPADVDGQGVRAALEAAGNAPMEGGVLWANYRLQPWNGGREPQERRSWQQVQGAAGQGRRVTFLMDIQFHQRMRAAADRRNVSMQQYIQDAVEAALDRDDQEIPR